MKAKKKKHGGRKSRPKISKSRPKKTSKSRPKSKPKKLPKKKGKRGRPKGSKNKTKTKTKKVKQVESKAKRGRPKGSKNKKASKAELKRIKAQIKEDLKHVKRSKFIGYCPSTECGAMVMKKDFVSPQIFICGSCEYRGRKNKLITEKEHRAQEEYKNKNEYISDVRNIEFTDMPEMKPKVEKIEVIK